MMGTVFSARTQRVCKGQTENWAHLPRGGGALFMVTSPFNEGLSGMLGKVVEEACRATGKEHLHLVFDRGGQFAEGLENLLAKGHDFTTYRKGGEDVAIGLFEEKETTIGCRTYAYAPLDRDYEMPVYEKKTDDAGKTARAKTGRTLKLREIRVVRADGEQTSILTSLPRDRHHPAAVAAELFDRTGNQENYFKYARREYDMDAKGIYKTEDVLDETLTHPNPAYVALAKKKSELAEKRRLKLAKYAADLLAATPEEVVEALASRGKKRLAEEIAAIDESIRKTEETIAKTPCRESVSKAEYKKLNEQARAFQYGFKMTADEIERKLVQMLAPHYPNASKEGRKFIADALKTQGDVRLEPGKIVVRLRPQSSPKRNRALNAVLQQINLRNAVYPGSHRVIFFEPSPDPVHVFHGA